MSHLEEIVKVVIYKSRENGNPVTETLAAFIAQTLLKPKTTKFFSEEKLNEKDIQMIIEMTLDKISHLDSPSMKTIQMQVQYDTNYMEYEYKRQEKLKQQSQETSKLIDEIMVLETKNGKDFEGLTLLYKKIFNYLLYKNKEIIVNLQGINAPLTTIANIKDTNVEKEVAAALESVIPRAALAPFVSLSNSEKVTQLCELSNLVIGIRLFNKEIGKGGASLATIKELTEHEGRNLFNYIKDAIIKTVAHCDDYTSFFSVLDHFTDSISKEQIEIYKDELTFLRQYLSYLLNFQDDIEVSENSIDSNQSRYHKEINELKNLLGNKSSAPKEQVYPKFAAVSQAYIQLVEEKALSNMRLDLFNLLEVFFKGFQLTLKPNLIETAKKINQYNAENKQPNPDIKIDSTLGIIRLMPNTTPDFMQTPLDYLGFCIWSIVKRNGLLVPGKPNLGVYKYKDKHCVFSSEQAIQEFVKDPGYFLQGVLDQCRKYPELIHLLRLDDVFKHVSLLSLLQGREGGGPSLSTKLMVDKGCETPVHFVEKNFDPNYCWNEWELRKKAIQMANIRNKQTKASQTIASNYKVDSETQVWLTREQGTNTGVNKGTNPLRPRNYIVGLRDKNLDKKISQ